MVQRPRVWQLLCLCLPPLLAGCQVPAARVAGCPCDGPPPPRAVALARQVACDSAVELAARPLQTSAAVVTEAADTLCAAAKGAVGKRLVLCLRDRPAPVPPCRPTLDVAALDAELARCTGKELQPASVQLHADGTEALNAVLKVIDEAQVRLDVLMFIWESDKVGQVLAMRLADRARAGVRVRVLVDGGGNLIYGRSMHATTADLNRAVCWLTEQPGVEVVRARNGFARFDHRKLVVADGAVAWTGGRNFTSEAFFDHHDLSFTLTGPLTAELAREFDRSWAEQGGSRIEDRADRLIPPRCGTVWGPSHPPRPQRSSSGEPKTFGPDRWPGQETRLHQSPQQNPRSSIVDPPNALARLVGTGPLRHDLADALLCAIDHARHHIYLENPYLCDSRVLLRLARARRRGVDVCVVMSLHTDTSVTDRSNRVTANYLLRAGARVFLYPGMTHLKVMSVDRRWAYIGTGNFDPLSLRHDYEVGLAIGAGPLVEEIEDQLLRPDLRPEWELRRPLPITLHDRLSEVLANLFL